jgi:predicted flap endonuclease-1-like 5' DNA nuclease
MLELIGANWATFAVAFLIGLATAWWVWARYNSEADIQPPKIEPSAPKAVADLAKEMPAATAPVPLMEDGVPKAKPKAKAAPKPKAAAAPKAKAAPQEKAAPKPKAAASPKVTAPKVEAKPAPKAKTAPVKKAAAPVAAPKAKVEAPKVKAVAAPKPKVAAKPAAKPTAKPAAKAEVKAAPKPKAVAKPKPAPKPVIPDNLELLKGVGPKLNTLLRSLGVTSFEQVANWSAADIREIDSKLGNFAGRITRDNWVDQAKLLVAGDIKGFEKKYGALGSEITG